MTGFPAARLSRVEHSLKRSALRRRARVWTGYQEGGGHGPRPPDDFIKPWDHGPARPTFDPLLEFCRAYIRAADHIGGPERKSSIYTGTKA